MSCGYFFYGNCTLGLKERMHCFRKDCPIVKQEIEDKFIKEKK